VTKAGRSSALELEHYPGMAEAEMRRIAELAIERFQAARPDRDPSLRQDRRGRKYRAGHCRRATSAGRLRRRQLRHGLPEDLGAVLEEGTRQGRSSKRNWIEAKDADDAARDKWR
jgi:molybdopterin synthase catalytic subunit